MSNQPVDDLIEGELESPPPDEGNAGGEEVANDEGSSIPSDDSEE